MSEHRRSCRCRHLQPDGSFLLGRRPEGKPYAGYWEFPGGKIEPGETAAQALVRELHEELGIEADRYTPWITREFVYPHAHVRLHFFRVSGWHGRSATSTTTRWPGNAPATSMSSPCCPPTSPCCGD
jgi:8-oxo-dGTP diphosphatase